jgi:hypothetical protein
MMDVKNMTMAPAINTPITAGLICGFFIWFAAAVRWD